MKKTIAIIGSAAALSFAGAGLAAAQEAPETGADQGTETATTTDEQATDQVDGEDGTADEAEDGTADDGETTDPETPSEVSDMAKQLCGSISAYDFLGSAEGVVPGLSGEECEANAEQAIETATAGDISGALDILRGIEAGTPGEDGETEEPAAGSLDSILESVGSSNGDDATDTEGDDAADDATDGAADESADDEAAATEAVG